MGQSCMMTETKVVHRPQSVDAWCAEYGQASSYWHIMYDDKEKGGTQATKYGIVCVQFGVKSIVISVYHV